MEKMTYVSALTYAIENGNLPEDVIAKLTALRGQQEKRSGAERKPTVQQTANEGFKAIILAYLADGEKRTITEIVKGAQWGDVEMSVNRCSALVRQLKESGAVVREEIKRKAYFSVAPVADTAE